MYASGVPLPTFGLSSLLSSAVPVVAPDKDAWEVATREIGPHWPVLWCASAGLDFDPIASVLGAGPYRLPEELRNQFRDGAFVIMSDYGSGRADVIWDWCERLRGPEGLQARQGALFGPPASPAGIVVPSGDFGPFSPRPSHVDVEIESAVPLWFFAPKEHDRIRSRYRTMHSRTEYNPIPSAKFDAALLRVRIRSAGENLKPIFVLYACLDNLIVHDLLLANHRAPVEAFCAVRCGGKSGSWDDVHHPDEGVLFKSIRSSQALLRPRWWMSDRPYHLPTGWRSVGLHEANYGVPACFLTSWDQPDDQPAVLPERSPDPLRSPTKLEGRRLWRPGLRRASSWSASAMIAAIAAGALEPLDKDDAWQCLCRLATLAHAGHLGSTAAWGTGSWLGRELDAFVLACEKLSERSRYEALGEVDNGARCWEAVVRSWLVPSVGDGSEPLLPLPRTAPHALIEARPTSPLPAPSFEARAAHARTVRSRARRPAIDVSSFLPIEERWSLYVADRERIQAFATYLGVRCTQEQRVFVFSALRALEPAHRDAILRVMASSKHPYWRGVAKAIRSGAEADARLRPAPGLIE